MKKQYFAVCDLEESYAFHLMEYLTERRSIPFEILAFSEVESLLAFAAENPVEILLISDRMMCDEIRRLSIGKIVILSDGEVTPEFSAYPTVYKYQPSDYLVAEVMNYYAHQAVPRTWTVLKRDVRVIGIYSPVNRCGKTCFALTLGQILAMKKSVLYINLEEYSGFESLTGQAYPADISDVLYFLRQNKGNVIFKLNAAVQRLGGMDYLPPAFSAGDLREISAAQWQKLIEEVLSAGGYDVLVLDIAETVEDKFALLNCCTEIYMPVLEDATARAKAAQYERLVKEMEYEELLSRTRRLNLPFCELPAQGEYCLEQLTEGSMGEFVRREILHEPGNSGI